MDLPQLRQFQALARAEHMTRAAQELGIDQSSLSRTIKRLETELGVPLFDRPGRRIRLNSCGRAFLEHVDRSLVVLEEGRRQVRDMARLDGEEIALAAAAVHWLPDLLRDFRQERASARFRLMQRPPEETRHLLELGKVDFGFSCGPMSSPCLRWRRLIEEEIFLAVPRGHRLDGRESVPLRDLAPEAMVMGGRGSVLRDLVDGACAQAGFAARVACEADDPAAIYGFVEAGLGVSFIPALVRHQRGEARQRNVSWLSIENLPLRLTLGIAWHEDRHLSEVARAFRGFVVSRLAAFEGNESA